MIKHKLDYDDGEVDFSVVTDHKRNVLDDQVKYAYRKRDQERTEKKNEIDASSIVFWGQEVHDAFDYNYEFDNNNEVTIYFYYRGCKFVMKRNKYTSICEFNILQGSDLMGYTSIKGSPVIQLTNLDAIVDRKIDNRRKIKLALTVAFFVIVVMVLRYVPFI